MPVNLHQSFLPPSLRGVVAVSSYGAPRFWATIWSDVLKTSLKPSTRRQHLSALERLYDATQRQRGSNCLDRLIAEADVDAL
ncbi:MAG: site-specific recombinase, partial [Mesorhizobium sp.]